MSSLPKSKADLRNYLQQVDEFVESRKGKLPFSGFEKVQKLLFYGGSDNLE